MRKFCAEKKVNMSMKINTSHLVKIICIEFLYYVFMLFCLGLSLMLYGNLLNNSLIAGIVFLVIFIMIPTIFNLYMWWKNKKQNENDYATTYLLVQFVVITIITCFIFNEII